MYYSCAKSNILYFVISLSDKIFVCLLVDWKGNKSIEWLEENGYESNYSVRFLAFSIFPILDIFLIITFHFDWTSNDISTILPYFFRSLVMCEWNFISIHFQERGKCQGLIPKLKKNYCLHIMNHKFIWDVANKIGFSWNEAISLEVILWTLCTTFSFSMMQLVCTWSNNW